MDFQGRSKLLKEYQMGKTIGQGAFSKVKLGYHRETGQKVAIKVIDKKVLAEKAEKSKEAHEEIEKRNKHKNVEIATVERTNPPTSPKPGPRSSPNESASADTTQYPESDDESLIVVHPIAGEAGFLSKLQLEVQLMLRLEHQNIVTVYQVIDSEEECFIIMQYASGGELIEYIASRGYLSEKEARKFFRQIISAIDHCHLANVVHRDLKLENLLLNAEKNILLSDFGLGRTFRDDLEEYMKTFCGTPNYAAVELISGIPYVGVKSDIWAMGVVLYLMVTGKPPFHGETISLLYKEIKAVNYKVYDTFSKDLRHLLTRMLCKSPTQRISIDELRQHPWVNFEEPEMPLRINPRVSGNVEPAALGQFILGMEYDEGVTTYRFHEHKKQEKPFSFGAKKPDNRRRANTVLQGNTISPMKKDSSGAQPSEHSKEKNGTFSFFRRISVTTSESSAHKQASSSSSPPKASPMVTPPIVKSEPSPRNSITSPAASPAIVAVEKLPQSLLIPEDKPVRRHSTMGSNLTAPIPNFMTRRASDTGVDPQFLKSGAEASGESHQNPTFFANFSAMLKKSSSSVARPESSNTSDFGSRDRFSRTPSGVITPIAPVNRLFRSITFNGQSPVLQIPVEEQTNAASPLIPPSTSIRQLRLAAHSPMVQRRESFGAKAAVSNDPEFKSSRVKGEKLLVPSAEDTLLGKVSNGKKEISKSYHAFLSMSESERPHQAGSEVMKSAILSNITRQVSDSEDRLGSHDMMSLTSRFTEAATSSDQDDSTHGEMESNIEYWKELNRPAKEIRSMRFSFNQKLSSTKEPSDIFRQLTITLNKLNQQRSQSITYSRTNPNYYLLICKLRNPFPTSDDPLIFEVEVCKVWLLKIHGLRLKRIAGSPLLFKELYAFLETELRI